MLCHGPRHFLNRLASFDLLLTLIARSPTYLSLTMKNHQLLPLALPFALFFGCGSNDNKATVHPPETAQHRTDSSDASFLRLADGYFDTY